MILECFELSPFKVDGVHVPCENFALTCLEQGEHKATIEFHIERDLIVTWPHAGPDGEQRSWSRSEGFEYLNKE